MANWDVTNQAVSGETVLTQFDDHVVMLVVGLIIQKRVSCFDEEHATTLFNSIKRTRGM